MNREDLQSEFKTDTKQPTMVLNKCEVGTNPEYVIWLENKVLALFINSVSTSFLKILKTFISKRFFWVSIVFIWCAFWVFMIFKYVC